MLIAALGVALVLSRHWPTDQTVRIVLGDAAPAVGQVRIRYGAPVGGDVAADDWQREVTFHYAPGLAPRIVSHEARLVNGDYDVQVEIRRLVMRGDADPTRAAGTEENEAVTVTRRVSLEGRAASIDVSRDVHPDSPSPRRRTSE